jgi:hypothetical protein
MSSEIKGCSASLNPNKSWISAFCNRTGYEKRWDNKTVIKAIGCICVGVVAAKIIKIYQQEPVSSALQTSIICQILDKVKIVAQDRNVALCSGAALTGVAVNHLAELSLNQLKILLDENKASIEKQEKASKQKDEEIEALRNRMSDLDARHVALAQQVTTLVEQQRISGSSEHSENKLPAIDAQTPAVETSAKIVREDLNEEFEVVAVEDSVTMPTNGPVVIPEGSPAKL